jgi:hypothetical protein
MPRAVLMLSLSPNPSIEVEVVYNMYAPVYTKYSI